MSVKSVARRLAHTAPLSPALYLYRRAYEWRMSFKSNEEIFQEIYHRNGWGDAESASGTGSNLRATEALRSALPSLLTEIGARSLLDAPCGDFNWMRHVSLDGVRYTGIDVVPEVVEANQRFADDRRTFLRLDLTADALPWADLILCRDALVHFPYRDIFRAVSNFRRSGATHLLTTTFPGHANRDVKFMSPWRPLDLRAEPFNFPEPLRLINEQSTEPGAEDKSLALWRLSDLT